MLGLCLRLCPWEWQYYNFAMAVYFECMCSFQGEIIKHETLSRSPSIWNLSLHTKYFPLGSQQPANGTTATGKDNNWPVNTLQSLISLVYWSSETDSSTPTVEHPNSSNSSASGQSCTCRIRHIATFTRSPLLDRNPSEPQKPEPPQPRFPYDPSAVKAALAVQMSVSAFAGWASCRTLLPASSPLH